MVRGHKDCPKFCRTCKSDCVCEKCKFCHSCRVPKQCKKMHTCVVKNASLDSEPSIECAHKLKLESVTSVFKSQPYRVVVGHGTYVERTTFFIHKNILDQHSVYFKSLFSFDSEAEKEQVSLSTEVDKPDAFACFIQFIYIGDYKHNAVIEKTQILPHADVYVLAERLQVEALKHLALKRATVAAVALSKKINESQAHKEHANVTAASSMDEAAPCPTTTLENVVILIRTTYGNTVSRTTSPPSENGRKRKADEMEGNEPETDPLRVLVSKFAGTCLDRLKKLQDFKDCLSDIPEFSQDVVLNLEKTKPLEMDLEGKLKLQ